MTIDQNKILEQAQKILQSSDEEIEALAVYLLKAIGQRQALQATSADHAIESAASPITSADHVIESAALPITSADHDIESAASPIGSADHALKSAASPTEPADHVIKSSVSRTDPSDHAIQSAVSPIEPALQPAESLPPAIRPLWIEASKDFTAHAAQEAFISACEAMDLLDVAGFCYRVQMPLHPEASQWRDRVLAFEAARWKQETPQRKSRLGTLIVIGVLAGCILSLGYYLLLLFSQKWLGIE